MTEVQRDSGELGVASELMQEAANGASPATPPIATRCAGRTAVGQVRDHNEDNFVVANLGSGQIRPRDVVCDDTVHEHGLMFAVCDGMGGAAAGEVASQMAVDILVEAMRRGGAPKNRDALARRLVSAVEEAGRRIFESAQKERARRGMGTTATVAVLIDKVLFLAEVGDSRGYLLRGGQLKQLTKDQSLVNQLIEAGHLTEAEAEAFEHSNIILQALGTSETVQVDLTFVELRRGDRLLLCSDGLSGLVHADALRETLASLKDPAECSAKLIEQAESAGGHDNITVVVTDFEGEALTEPAEGESFGYVQYPLPLAEGESSAFTDEDTERSSGEAATAAAPSESPAATPSRPSPRRSRDQGESLLPLSGDAADGQGSLVWIAIGALALAAGVAVWLSIEPHAHKRRDEGAELAVPLPPPPPVAAAAPAVEPVPEDVEVQIHTDVERATLLVNGEARGDLGPGSSRTLKLRPGAYRFEAQAGGNPAAVSVVTVQGGTPMDVFLQRPKAPEEAVAEPEQPIEPRPKPESVEAAPVPRPRPPREPKPASTTESPSTPPAAVVSAPPVAAPKPAPAPAATPTPPPTARPARPGAPVAAEPTANAQEIPDNPF